MHKKLLFLIFITFNSLYPNILLEPPRYISDEDIQNKITQWKTEFHWCTYFNGYVGILCTYQNSEAAVMLHAGHVPLRTYNFDYIQAIKEIFSQKQQIANSYFFDEPLVSSGNPQKIDVIELFKLIKDKRFIFYTGAGISARNVATMSKLEESMHMQQGALHFLKIMLLKPQILARAFEKFCKSCIDAQPTFAHEALHKIAQQKSCAIITENVDLLHQKTHSMPLDRSSSELRTLKSGDIQEIDMIICVGLSHDDCGMLQYFKRHNPAITIAAIDIGNPNYLSESDYLIQEDLQIAVPSLAKMLEL